MANDRGERAQRFFERRDDRSCFGDGDLPHDGAANVEACTDLVGNGREAVLDDALVRLLRLGGLSGPAGTVGGLPTSSGAKPRVCAQPDCKRLAADRASGSCSEALTQSCPPPKVRHAARVGAKFAEPRVKTGASHTKQRRKRGAPKTGAEMLRFMLTLALRLLQRRQTGRATYPSP
jgi:hypothetical protein